MIIKLSLMRFAKWAHIREAIDAHAKRFIINWACNDLQINYTRIYIPYHHTWSSCLNGESHENYLIFYLPMIRLRNQAISKESYVLLVWRATRNCHMVGVVGGFQYHSLYNTKKSIPFHTLIINWSLDSQLRYDT